FVKISVPDGSCRAIRGADALLFYLSSPYNIESSRFVSSLNNLLFIALNCCNKQQTTQLFCSMDWEACQITVH
ncbi:hypothetical protein ACKEXU_18230, partial [Yersinia enterocolitica]